jgi:hypothetical protein
MSVTKRGKAWAVGLFAGALIGGGIALVTPAGAAVQGAAAAIDWKQVWKSEIKPRADKRYYSKKKSNQRYYTKTEVATLLGPYVDTPELVAALAGYYTKAQTDAALANYYTKTQIDAKLAPFQNSVAAFAGGDQNVALGAVKVVRSVSLMPPKAGTVVVSYGADILTSGTTTTILRCSLTTGNTLDFSALQLITVPDSGTFDYDTIAGTRGFPVTQGNLLTVNLVCDLFQGAADMEDSALSATFAPN